MIDLDLGSKNTSGSPMEFTEFITEIMSYFKGQGWSEEYAWSMITKQSQDIALEKLSMGDRTGREMNIGPDSYKDHGMPLEITKAHVDYMELVDRICTVLAPYKKEEDLERMRRDLMAIVLKHRQKWKL